MKKFITLMLAVLMALSTMTACGGTPAPEATPEPTPTPRMYFPNPFTGEEKTADYNEGVRPVAIMINNISVARPQSGLSQASILIETKVEGGITRFMGIFEDYTKLEDVGPVRSGRDQFLRLAMPYEALYMHIGRSEITQTYIDTFEYNDLDVNGSRDGVYLFYRRNRPGKDLEHTAYTNGEIISDIVETAGINMKKYYDEPVFDFVPYDLYPEGRQLGGEAADTISIVHSQANRTYFEYDKATGKYLMSQYNGSKGIIEPTIDENNGEQLAFENVIVLRSAISKYDYPADLDPKYDPNYQYLFLDWGLDGCYFSGGASENIWWGKGGPPDALYFCYDNNPDNRVELNPGKTYIAFVDEEEWPRFEFAGSEEDIIDENVDMSGVVEEEIGETE